MEVTSVFTYSTSCVQVQDQSQVGEARRKAAELARNLQLDEESAGRASIIVTELGNNLIHHGGGGELLFNPVWTENGTWLDIVAIDRGDGMYDIARCLEDGFSTIGTAGQGLGAVNRLSGLFEVLSLPEHGTVALARLYNRNQAARCSLDIGAINLPKCGEEVSGDSWAARHLQGRVMLIVADGLGHGISAAEASKKAVHSFSTQQEINVTRIMEDANSALHSTRGAAVSVVDLNVRDSKVVYSGVGNITGMLIKDNHQTKTMLSHNGIIGHGAKKIHELEYQWVDEEIIALYSDGIQSQWTLKQYPGIFRRSATLIAALIYRDFSRGSDDIAVVVVKK